jgi:hypothetical protein
VFYAEWGGKSLTKGVVFVDYTKTYLLRSLTFTMVEGIMRILLSLVVVLSLLSMARAEIPVFPPGTDSVLFDLAWLSPEARAEAEAIERADPSVWAAPLHAIPFSGTSAEQVGAVNAVPEPSTFALWSIGALCILPWLRKKV